MSELRAVRFHDGDRWVCGVSREGTKRLHVVHIDDGGVRVHSEHAREALRHCEPLTLKGKPYPVERAVKHLKRFGRERGITQAAKDILAEVT